MVPLTSPNYTEAAAIKVFCKFGIIGDRRPIVTKIIMWRPYSIKLSINRIGFLTSKIQIFYSTLISLHTFIISCAFLCTDTWRVNIIKKGQLNLTLIWCKNFDEISIKLTPICSCYCASKETRQINHNISLADCESYQYIYPSIK